MKKLLLMMLVVGACSTVDSTIDSLTQEEMKEAFVAQVADKSFALGTFYDDGDLEDYDYGVFTIYEMIDSNIAIYKATEEDSMYLKVEIKDGKIWVTNNYNCTTSEQAKESELMEYEFIK